MESYRQRVGRGRQQPQPNLDEEFNASKHAEWFQLHETQRLLDLLERYYAELHNNAEAATGKDGKTLRRLLNKAKAINEVIEYVRTGNNSGIRLNENDNG